RPDVPDGARAQRATPARGADPRADRAAPLRAPVRGAPRLALPPRDRVSAVRPADPRRRGDLRADAAARRPREQGAARDRPRAARVRLAGPAELGALDDDGGDRLEGARLRRDPLPRPLALAAGRDVRGGAGRRRTVLPPAPLRYGASALGRNRVIRRGRGDHDGLVGLQL